MNVLAAQQNLKNVHFFNHLDTITTTLFALNLLDGKYFCLRGAGIGVAAPARLPVKIRKEPVTINYQYSYLVFLAFSVGACSGMAPEAYPPGAERVPSSTEEAVSADSAWQDSPGEEPSSTLTDLSGPAARPSYEPGTIEIDANGFIINGEYTYLRGGTVQYFKIPQSSWRDRLQRFKAAGFNTIAGLVGAS